MRFDAKDTVWYHRGDFEYHPATVLSSEGVNKYKIAVFERAYAKSKMLGFMGGHRRGGSMHRPSKGETEESSEDDPSPTTRESTGNSKLWHWERKVSVASAASLTKRKSFQAGDHVTFKTETQN